MRVINLVKLEVCVLYISMRDIINFAYLFLIMTYNSMNTKIECHRKEVLNES